MFNQTATHTYTHYFSVLSIKGFSLHGNNDDCKKIVSSLLQTKQWSVTYFTSDNIVLGFLSRLDSFVNFYG